jgi:hypothetical protein
MNSLATPQPSSRKSVSFNEYCASYQVLHINDYDSHWIKKCWYSSSELSTMRLELKPTLFKMECGTPLSKIKDCTMGLETFTEGGQATKRHNRVTSQNAVFFEQGYQQCQGIVDPQGLADTYFEHTSDCQRKAHERGLQYEQQAVAARGATLLAPCSSSSHKTKEVGCLSLDSSLGGLHRYKHQDLRMHKVNSRAA